MSRGWIKLCLFLVVALLLCVFFDPLSLVGKLGKFPVKKVQLNGAHQLTLDEIERDCAKLRGVDQFKLRIHPLKKCIEGFGWVKEARISRRLPDSLEIQVREENPVAIVRNQEKWIYMSLDMKEIAPISESETLSLPMIPQFDQLNAPQKRTVLDLSQFLQSQSLNGQISDISFNQSLGWVGHLNSGTQILFGQEIIHSNISRLKVILQKYPQIGQTKSTIDLHIDKKVIVKGVKES